MARKKRRARPIPEIDIIETLQPAPADLDFGTKEEPKHWYLVWTRPRGEAKAAEGLAEAGCQVFWPHFERVIRRKNKPEIRNLISTFPRYLFASGLPKLAQRLTVVGPDGKTGVTIDGRPIEDIREIEGVVAVIRNERGWCPVPRSDIEKIAKMHGDHAQPVSSNQRKPRPVITPGERVLIIEGPFASFYATVIESVGMETARVLIDIFGRKTPAEFDLAQIAAA
jgi:transcription antitermination factor NusG